MGGRDRATMEKLERTPHPAPALHPRRGQLSDEVKSSLRALNDDKNMLLKLRVTLDQLRKERAQNLPLN